eukprot:1177409-Rhodomonas_salina.2
MCPTDAIADPGLCCTAVRFCESKHESLSDFISAEELRAGDDAVDNTQIASDWTAPGAHGLRLRNLTEAACFDLSLIHISEPTRPRLI